MTTISYETTGLKDCTFATVHQYHSLNTITIVSWNEKFRPKAEVLKIHRAKLVGVWNLISKK